MRKLEFINPNGVSTIFGNGSTKFGITSLEGTGIPGVVNQSQRAPYQDGETPIDQLLEPRDIDVEGIFLCGKNRTLEYGYRRELCAALNAKLGVGTLVYTNDYGSWSIGAQLSENGLIFANNNVNDGAMRFMVTFHCPDPYWQDVADTVVTLTTGAADQVVNITGDVQTPVKIDVTGISKYPTIYERLQEKYMQYQQVLDQKLSINTSFGNKTAVLNYNDVWRTRGFSGVTAIASDELMTIAVTCQVGVMTSYNGETWTLRDEGCTNGSYGIAYSAKNNLWCIVGAQGRIRTSPDTITWTARTSGVSNTLNGIFFSESQNLWCAVGESGTILTSPEGVTWTQRTSGTDVSLYGVCFSETQNKWSVVGEGITLTSSDGSTWTGSSVTANLYSVSYSTGINQWCAVGHESSPGKILTSTDAITWTSQGSSLPRLKCVFRSESQNLWCAVGDAGAILTSTDGAVWTQRTSGTTDMIYGVFYSSMLSKWISAAGPILINSVGIGSILYSSDSISWVKVSGSVGGATAISYSKKQKIWCAVRGRSSYTSIDGILWTAHDVGVLTDLQSVAFNEVEVLWCAVGESGTILTSPDAITWTQRTSGTTNRLYGVNYSETLKQWCAVGYYNTLLTSSDGLSWTTRISGGGDIFKSVFFSTVSGRWVVVGDGSTSCAYSTDGITWHTISIGSSGSQFYSVSYGSYFGLWCAVGTYLSNGIVFISTDGITWELKKTVTGKALTSVSFSETTKTCIFMGQGGFGFSTNDFISYTDVSVIGISNSGYNAALAHSSVLDYWACSASGFLFTSSGDSTANVIQYMSRDTSWLQLQPGRNVLALTAAAGSASATVTYRNRYIGV